MTEKEKPQKPIAVQDEQPVSFPFSLENSKIIRSMVGKYGVDEEDVVINALILLYSIAQKSPSAKYITVQGPTGVINIPLTII